MRRNPRLLTAMLALLAVLGATWITTAAPAANQARTTNRPAAIAGTWSGRYSGAFSGTFTLHWTLSRSILRGSITLSNPGGKYGISGRVKGSAISFGAVGVGATYTGSVSGKTMSGTYKSPQGGGKWSAHKT